MAQVVKVWTYGTTKQFEMKLDETIGSLRSRLKRSVTDASKLEAIVGCSTKLIFKGQLLRDEQKLSDLKLTEQDRLIFAYPIIDPEPTRQSPQQLWVKKNSGTEKEPAASLPTSFANALDGILSQYTNRPTMPSMTSGAAAEALQELMNMGFPEFRCKKALLLNNMNLNSALEWLCEHIEDPDIDDPLTDDQLQRCDRTMRNQAKQQAKTKESQMKDDLAACLESNTCSYSATGPNMAEVGEYYMCYTCDLDGARGCCGACAKMCHAGHVLYRKAGILQFYCDCPEANLCKCVPDEAKPKLSSK